MSTVVAGLKTEWSEMEDGFLVVLGGASDMETEQIANFMKRRGLHQISNYRPDTDIPVMIWSGSTAAGFKQSIDGTSEISAIENVLSNESAMLATVSITKKGPEEFLLSSINPQAIDLVEELMNKLAQTDQYFATHVTRQKNQIRVRHPGGELKKILTPA